MIRKGLVWSSVLVLIMSAMAIYGMTVIPNEAQVAIHWGLNGEPDRFANKTIALWTVPGIALAVSLFLTIFPKLEPRRKHLLDSSSLFIRGWVGSLLLLIMVQGVVLASAIGIYVPVVKMVTFTFGFFLILMGNILGKSQSNFIVGIKTPWTLSSDVAWDKTHRLAGRLWVLGGLAMIPAGAFVPESYAHYIPLTVIPFVSLMPVIASYFYWRGASDKQTGDA